MQEKSELNDIILNKSSKSNNTKKILLTIAIFAIIVIIVVLVMNALTSNTNNLPQAPQEQLIVEEVVQEPNFEVTDEQVSTPAPQAQERDDDTLPIVEEDSVTEVTQMPQDANSEIKAPSYATEATPVIQPKAKPTPTKSVETTPKVEVFEEPLIEQQAPQKTTKKVIPKTTPKSSTPKAPKKQQIFRPSGKYDPKSQSVKNTKAKQTVTTTAVSKGQYYVQVGSFAKYAPSKAFLTKIEDAGYTHTYYKVNKMTKVVIGPFKTQSSAREALRNIRSGVIPSAFLTKF